ncbi:hypothetical protein MWU58_13965 [Flavobacteriaceae bacterium S0825]|uniref:hypothetical protein n=1 Tax=Gaetbulibacter sp. S0825 TaxID=2720084 RepID=UPI00142F42AD|nr:hypothetical protein [Gaetbulibacter sp. S0825]MCK0110403.1 hypothetical protein [Flavobacteriaceae bacterium S0825]NIX66032.1 hypothetical protein [Gaetbulibacter sp. S0825]
MELVLSHQEFEPLPKKKREHFVFNNEGILSSAYKEEIKNNFFQSSPKSVFGVKQRIKSFQYQYTLGIDAVLKLSVFAIAIIAVFS